MSAVLATRFATPTAAAGLGAQCRPIPSSVTSCCFAAIVARSRRTYATRHWFQTDSGRFPQSTIDVCDHRLDGLRKAERGILIHTDSYRTILSAYRSSHFLIISIIFLILSKNVPPENTGSDASPSPLGVPRSCRTCRELSAELRLQWFSIESNRSKCKIWNHSSPILSFTFI
jgi:hypothetical protein